MRLYVERWKRRAKLSHLIHAESNRCGEGDRCTRDEISSDERASHDSCWNINSARSFRASAAQHPTCAKRERSRAEPPLSDRASLCACDSNCGGLSDLRDYTMQDYMPRK